MARDDESPWELSNVVAYLESVGRPRSKTWVVHQADAGLLPIEARTVRGTRLFAPSAVKAFARQLPARVSRTFVVRDPAGV